MKDWRTVVRELITHCKQSGYSVDELESDYYADMGLREILSKYQIILRFLVYEIVGSDKIDYQRFKSAMFQIWSETKNPSTEFLNSIIKVLYTEKLEKEDEILERCCDEVNLVVNASLDTGLWDQLVCEVYND